MSTIQKDASLRRNSKLKKGVIYRISPEQKEDNQALYCAYIKPKEDTKLKNGTEIHASILWGYNDWFENPCFYEADSQFYVDEHDLVYQASGSGKMWMEECEEKGKFVDFEEIPIHYEIGGITVAKEDNGRIEIEDWLKDNIEILFPKKVNLKKVLPSGKEINIKMETFLKKAGYAKKTNRTKRRTS